MKIKYFLLLVFSIGIALTVYTGTRYIKGVEIESTTAPITNYQQLDIHCAAHIRDTSSMQIFFDGQSYTVTLSDGLCEEIRENTVTPTLFYYQEKDVVFQEGLLMPKVYISLSFFSAILLPLIGFIVYRKELNNSVSSM